MKNAHTFDPDFVRLATPVLAEFGFSSIKELVVEQANLMLQAKIDHYEAESRMYESRYGRPYETLVAEQQVGAEECKLDDDLNDWRFAKEAVVLYRNKMREIGSA